MKGYLGGAALMLLSAGAAATQLQIKNIDYHYPNSTTNQYRLPWFSSTDNPQAAKRINDFIFSRFLNHLPGQDAQSTLNQLANARTEIQGTASLDYSVEYLDRHFLTLNIFAEGCGAYCESYNVPLVFDLATGNAVTLDQIVNPQAIAGLNDRVRKNIGEKISTFISQQKALPVDQQRVEDGKIVDYAAFYADCLARINTSDGADYNYIDRFSPDDKQITFLNERCSNHATRALDDLGDFKTEIPLTTIKDALTPYGQNILSVNTKQSTTLPPSLNNKLLYGTLGKNMRIVLNVKCEHSYLSGAYFYEKYGTAIELTGNCSPENNQHYELTTMSDEAAKEKFTLDLKDGYYQGSWESNGKTLPVRFE